MDATSASWELTAKRLALERLLDTRGVRPDPVGPGQESVWQYPRPPRVEATSRHVRVELDGRVVAESRRCLRVLETAHPPTYYVPLDDLSLRMLRREGGTTTCEWKGRASYYTVRAGRREVTRGAWSYHDPRPGYEALEGHFGFYAQRMDACYVDGERARPQPGDLYGGWITAHVVGPFKGGVGTTGW